MQEVGDNWRISYEHLNADSPGKNLFRIVYMIALPTPYKVIRYYDDESRVIRLLEDIRNSPNKKLVDYKTYRIEAGR